MIEEQKKYFYTINYPIYEESLCKMEMRYLFDNILKEKYFFSNKYINPSRSPFIKDVISIIYCENSLEAIVDKVTRDKLAYDDFKICYIKLENEDVNYKERLRSIREIGLVIIGESEMHNPKITLGLTKINGKWIFGEYKRNDYKWHIHDDKPCSYSNALGIRVAKAVVNIAMGNDFKKTLVDPCCGVGTVVIEAISMNIKVKGYELNENIAANAKRNLEFFGYDKDIIVSGNMHDIKEKYDVAIVDIPYGLFTPTTLDEQTNIIKTARRIADKLIIITFENMDKYIIDAGFKIFDKGYVNKGKFKRYINVCI
jgi:tRNA G10  N-methylase Trm11